MIKNWKEKEVSKMYNVVLITGDGRRGNVLYTGSKSDCYKYRATLSFKFKYKVLVKEVS